MSKSPVQINIETPPPPSAEEIYEWLMDTYGLLQQKASSWARYLEGLPWGYIKPVCKIAVSSHHDHPALVLSAAAGLSDDILFKLTARNHIAAKGETP